jgi:hypothetical protein
MFGLSLLYPAFLIGAASAAIPVILHLLARQSAPRLPFSAVRFLKRVPIDQSRRRLRELLLLALRVVALGLLAVAFARPFFVDAAARASAVMTVVAVDTSFSMSAPGQFERARRLAREAVEAVPLGQPVGVVTFGDAADIVAPPSANRADAIGAIARLQPGLGGTRYRAALARAAELIGARRGRVVVVTDLQRRGFDWDDRSAIPAGIAVAVADAGSPAGNLAVTDIRRDGTATIAVLRNAGVRSSAGRARLAVDGRNVADAPFAVDAGVFSEVRFAHALPVQGAVSVAVDDADGYAPDNVRYLAVDPPRPARVLAVTGNGRASPDAFYLERALLADSESGRFAWTGTSTGNLASTEDIGQYSTVLLLSVRGLEGRGRDLLRSYVNGGGGLLIAVGLDVEPDVLQRSVGDAFGLRLSAGSAGRLTFAPVDPRHPIFRPFGSAVGNLGAVQFTRFIRVEGADNAQVIARFSNGTPALLELRVGSGRAMVFASDLNREGNDFPLHPAFLPFVHETVRYLAAAREAPRDYLVADAPSGVPRTPGVFVLEEKRAVGDPGSAPARQGRSRRVAVNVDPGESDPARMTAEQFAGSIVRRNEAAATVAASEAAHREEQQRLWRYGLMAMLVSLVGEAALGRRL